MNSTGSAAREAKEEPALRIFNVGADKGGFIPLRQLFDELDNLEELFRRAGLGHSVVNIVIAEKMTFMAALRSSTRS